jgi:hypothetical protein
LEKELDALAAHAGAQDFKDVGKRPLSALVAADGVLKNQEFEKIGDAKTRRSNIIRRTIITFARHHST